MKDELESLKTQLLRKDSHVNSLELSLTQKNEEIEMIEDKLQRATKQLQQQQMLSTSPPPIQQQSYSNSNLAEIESLKLKIAALQKDVNTKDVQIQQLETELVTLKELIDDFEEQKQVLKYKLEQQQIQFGQLERQYEQTTMDYESQLKDQQKQYEASLAAARSAAVEAEETANSNRQIDYKSVQTDAEEKKTTAVVSTSTEAVPDASALISAEAEMMTNQERDKYEAELEDQLNIIKNLQDQLEIERIEVAEREEQIGRLTSKLKEMENALRESVSITAEREIVFAQQKKKAEKLEDEVWTFFVLFGFKLD